jgi:periplasmic protein CpxP/Spy
MMRGTRLVLAGAIGALVLGTASAPVLAQQPPQRNPNVAARQGTPSQNRMQLEREVRERIHGIMRREMGLTDAQVERLDGTLEKFELRRRVLLREERQLRSTLRDAMTASRAAGDTAVSRQEGARIAATLDSLVALQRRRLELVEQEQRELATFLTPMQRARYFALQENLRRVLEERPAGRRPAPAGGGGNPPPE